MARLFEYQSKELLKAAGLNVPKGRVVGSPEEARAAAEELGGEVVLKVQAWVTGRASLGGIKIARTPAQASQLAPPASGNEDKELCS